MAANSNMNGTNPKITGLAVIGKNNNPLYIRNFTNQPSLKYHFLAHTSCDVLEEKGLLYIMEDLSVYGYMTNTRIKFVLMVTVADTAIKDQDIKGIFRKIHSAYVDLQLDPFWDPETSSMISNQNFIRQIDAIVMKSSFA
ncbi:hypothetical protein BATDEDRAFT_85297 [Batrachochytrium dendrobatidis JAM81]|uniref:Trafficking protein particle complex subunit 2-like protein n=1 Tax=Batrachochytrium dendrobatidis (strain JAM81 / FGSC 10211) TaxID=684364 RepID=F4NTK6_BATDJ|nr:uncharacterized protein BATDEDRAFT_85297 [Batrachochytrium dendrobatidis JAM81]EGF84339.1 hypothetical protein BATDEDRAFT_85297 [Batrachochytrium dendrobatidis JAM81]|eukprot:XP_006676409.1 hypothetical protein BATDEDRAFT_85297 [Batrachochytrium dendrobatidis JAM81]